MLQTIHLRSDDKKPSSPETGSRGRILITKQHIFVCDNLNQSVSQGLSLQVSPGAPFFQTSRIPDA